MIKPEVEKIKQATFSDGLGKQDTTKSIMIIQYWNFFGVLQSPKILLSLNILRLMDFFNKKLEEQD